MADITKIVLSDKELSLVKNVEWILTKQTIIQKVFELFAQTVAGVKETVLTNHSLPAEISLSVPKIYKGENYLDLPYVIMDYPRSFGKEAIFAIRTMFWWGHFFSITLHVSGVHKSLLKQGLHSDDLFLLQDFFVGVNEDPWQHHFEKNNFMPVRELSGEECRLLFEKNNFIKLAVKYELDKWNEMPSLLYEGYTKISRLLV